MEGPPRRKRKSYRKLFKRPPKGLRPYWRRTGRPYHTLYDFRGFDVPPPPPTLTSISIGLVDCVLHPQFLEMGERPPIRVLSLFDGIGTGYHVLQSLGLNVQAYFSCETDSKAISLLQYHYHGKITMLGDVKKLTTSTLIGLGRVDLLIGGSPCSDLSLVNPARRGLHGSGTTGGLFFDYIRVRDVLALQGMQSNHSFYWLFENTCAMEKATLEEMCLYLRASPVVRCSSAFTAMVRRRFFWGNVPGMYKDVAQRRYVNDNCHLQNYLQPYRSARIDIVPTITTSQHSQRSGSWKALPVSENGEEKQLFITEIERLFGFPDHFTDGPNLSVTDRRRLLGKAWCVPVIKAILAPLRALFQVESVLTT